MRRFWIPLLAVTACPAFAQVAVKGETVYTMAGAAIKDGIVLVKDGKIEKVGRAGDVAVPAGYKTLEAKVVTPGLVDAHTVVGLTGYLNQPHDQEQVEASGPIQPELRAIDAYDPTERLVEWVRGFGVTTMHTGHGPLALVSGQTMIVKTRGNSADEAVMVPTAMIAVTLANASKATEEGKSPGTRSKMMAMLRGELVKAQEYQKKKDNAEKGKEPERNLRTEVWVRVLKGELPLLVTAYRVQDIISTLRLASEFKIKVVLDGASEVYLALNEVKKAGIPVILHPTMSRSFGDQENQSMETAATLQKAGIPYALQSGFEGYVPKTRVILFEAAIAAANGLTFDEALGAITLNAARILGVDKRVGSLEVGKDGDLALYDGDPFEYTTHCIATVIDGQVVNQSAQ
jgi:imidazolonepropionase-like amidohydrolase